MYRVCKKLKHIEFVTKQMNKEMSSLDHRLEKLQAKLNDAQGELENDPYNPHLILEEKKILLELERWSNIHERVLRQKSKVVWINHGNSNSKFFYTQLKVGQARNSIVSIWNDQGVN